MRMEFECAVTWLIYNICIDNLAQDCGNSIDDAV